MTEPTANQALAYVTEKLSATFGDAPFDPSDIDTTLTRVANIVGEMRGRILDITENNAASQYRFAALDAAIRIMSDTKDTALILTRAKTIENYLSGVVEGDSITS